MQRGRRLAWTHARHVRGLSMFESIRLSQRLAETFAEWTRSGVPDLEALEEALRRAEEHMRRPESLEAHAAFVEAFATLSGRDGYASPMDTALDAFRTLDQTRPAAAQGG